MKDQSIASKKFTNLTWVALRYTSWTSKQEMHSGQQRSIRSGEMWRPNKKKEFLLLMLRKEVHQCLRSYKLREKLFVRGRTNFLRLTGSPGSPCDPFSPDSPGRPWERKKERKHSSKPWSSQFWTQFKQWRTEAWKSQDFFRLLFAIA